MAAARNVAAGDGSRVFRDEEESVNGKVKEGDESPTAKRFKSERFPLTHWEFAAFVGVFLLFVTGLFCIYLTMPAADYGKLKLPRTIADLRLLKDNLATYAQDYPVPFIIGYCSTYIFMQTFMIPGTIFMSLLAGALFGVIRGLILVVFNATAGASSCFFLSKLIGRPLVSWFWPEKLRFFQAEIAKRREKLLNYMLFLRITPSLPNLFINLASPIVDIPFHIFFLATLIGLIPASYITVRTLTSDPLTSIWHIFNDVAPTWYLMVYISCTTAPQAGLALGDLQSVKDLYDFKTLLVLFLIGSVIILPTLLKRKRIYE
ncbi:putative membrane protein [Citrus sinensis]|uniref:Membrane protein n=1 Tax=Citrus sinensis TaxID=2711 RepID=A0ACB8KTZ1_CITSI|nr:putative membrane protein [Citrus sinensis]